MRVSITEILLIVATICFAGLLYSGINEAPLATEIIISDNELSNREVAVTEAGISLETPQGPINVNTADAENLCRLPNIGEVLAERIIAYREANGGIKDPLELMKIEGIGEKTYLGLSELIVLED